MLMELSRTFKTAFSSCIKHGNILKIDSYTVYAQQSKICVIMFT